MPGGSKITKETQIVWKSTLRRPVVLNKTMKQQQLVSLF